MNVLILGGSGLLGSEIYNQFKESKIKEVYAPNSLELDLTNHRQTIEYVHELKPSLIFHCAAKVYGLGGNLVSPDDVYFHNSRIDLNVFDAVRGLKECHLVYSGSAASYGYPFRQLPLSEEDFFKDYPHDGEFFYGMQKRHSLESLELFRRNGNTYTYAILTNLFGRNDNFDIQKGHVIPSLIAKFQEAEKTGKEVEIWGTGYASRDFLYSRDAAKILIRLSEKKFQGLINVGSGKEVSMRELANMLGKLHSGVRFTWNVDKPEGIKRRILNVDKLKEIYQQPLTSLDAALAETVSNFRGD